MCDIWKTGRNMKEQWSPMIICESKHNGLMTKTSVIEQCNLCLASLWNASLRGHKIPGPLYSLHLTSIYPTSSPPRAHTSLQTRLTVTHLWNAVPMGHNVLRQLNPTTKYRLNAQWPDVRAFLAWSHKLAPGNRPWDCLAQLALDAGFQYILDSISSGMWNALGANHIWV